MVGRGGTYEERFADLGSAAIKAADSALISASSAAAASSPPRPPQLLP